MGLSHYPDPADAGMLCIILVHAAKYISTMREMVRFILQTIGIHIVSWEEFNITESPLNLIECHESSSEASIEEFRSQIPAMHYDSLCSKLLEHDCSVCLTSFRPKAVINHLSCGHVFHKVCVEKWIKYHKITCPNCRTNMIHQADEEEEEDTCPM
ncbi:putative E3 ubiquitin-protein ligase XERICO [Apium graveolens]|uniref:putative E3 ubiquitin-protein ligase XERICO n=1 Tax=Apium graveolens TaxID=4045 RepID=UPI003D7B80FE